jgi:hypothetical protein
MASVLQIKRSFDTTSDFTKIPNAVLRNKQLAGNPAAAWTYLLLLSLGKSRIFANSDELAAYIGYSPRAFRANLSKLRLLGLVDGGQASGIVQLLPPQDAPEFELPAEEPALEPELENRRIISEVEKQPKRKTTGLTQKDRWELVKEAWNKHKPASYLALDGSINTPLLIAIETHTKRLKLDRDDYDYFIGAVLTGAANDDWWSNKDLKASAVFGFGSELKDGKFETVEKLHNRGAVIRESHRLQKRDQEREESRRREEAIEFHRQQQEENERAKATNQKLAAIEQAWEASKPEGWQSIKGDAAVSIAVEMIANKLKDATESYEDFLRKAFEGYPGKAEQPRVFADPRMISKPESTMLGDSYLNWKALNK